MKNKKGFTLMEILLAALIVGVIGLALAALTTAAVRESGVGRSKVMLRHQLSVALRQLRQDVENSTSILVSADGENITLTQGYGLGYHHEPKTITYTFEAGSISSQDGVSTIGGKIKRTTDGVTRDWLSNVKHYTAGTFKSPSFAFLYGTSTEGHDVVHSVLRVRIIVEVPTEPVVNDVIEEVFMIPQGLPNGVKPVL